MISFSDGPFEVSHDQEEDVVELNLPRVVPRSQLADLVNFLALVDAELTPRK